MSKFNEYLQKVKMIKEDRDSEEDLRAIDKSGNSTLDFDKVDGFKIVIGKPADGKKHIFGKNATVKDVYNQVGTFFPFFKEQGKLDSESYIYVGSKERPFNRLKPWLGGENVKLIDLNKKQGPFKEESIEFDLVPTDTKDNVKTNNGKRYTISEIEKMLIEEKKKSLKGEKNDSPTRIKLVYFRDALPSKT